MSKYEDYNTTSRNYDNQRFALGADVASGMIPFYANRPLKDLHVLDAGCGTGNFALEMIIFGVGRVTLLDGSEGMLEKAKSKLSEHIESGKVCDVVLATMPPIPFPDATFDAIMFNLVLHHFEKNPDGVNFPTIEATLIDARRVLKPGGILSISTSFPLETATVLDDQWFAQLNTDIGKRYVKKYPNGKQWEEMFRKAGFDMLNIAQTMIQIPPKQLSDLRDGLGPTRKEWRDCNSYWASATPEELADVEKKVKQMEKDGILEQFVNNNDRSEGHLKVDFLFGRVVS